MQPQQPQQIPQNQYQSQQNQTAQPFGSYNQIPQKKNKIPLIIGIVTGVILLLAGAVIAVYFLFFHISKDDYANAQKTLVALNKKRNGTGNIIGSTSSIVDEESAKEFNDKNQQGIKEVRELVNKLRAERATKDNEVKKFVETIASKDTKAIEIASVVSTDASTFMPIAQNCKVAVQNLSQGNKPADVSAAIKVLQSLKEEINICVSALNKNDTYKSNIIKQFNDAFIETFSSMGKEIGTIINAFSIGDNATVIASNTKLQDLSSKLQAELSTLQSDFQNEIKDYDSTEDAKKLNNLLKKKAE